MPRDKRELNWLIQLESAAIIGLCLQNQLEVQERAQEYWNSDKGRERLIKLPEDQRKSIEESLKVGRVIMEQIPDIYEDLENVMNEFGLEEDEEKPKSNLIIVPEKWT